MILKQELKQAWKDFDGFRSWCRPIFFIVPVMGLTFIYFITSGIFFKKKK